MMLKLSTLLLTPMKGNRILDTAWMMSNTLLRLWYCLCHKLRVA